MEHYDPFTRGGFLNRRVKPSSIRPQPFGGPQIAAVTNMIRAQQQSDRLTEGDPVHPLDADVEDAIKATDELHSRCEPTD